MTAPGCRDCGYRLDEAIRDGRLGAAAHNRRDTHPLCDPNGVQRRWNARAAHIRATEALRRRQAAEGQPREAP